MRQRPRDGFGLFCHGTAALLPEGEERQALAEHLADTYGASPEDFGVPIAYFRIDATWLTAFAMTDEEMVAIEADRAARGR